MESSILIVRCFSDLETSNYFLLSIGYTFHIHLFLELFMQNSLCSLIQLGLPLS